MRLTEGGTALLTEFMGESVIVQNLLREALVAARGGDRPILITGPVGAGKSHLARYIHRESPRVRGPLVFVDCGSMPELDNVLFGHRSGAFTGATYNLGGRLKQADRGVLVLDDFERLNPQQQDRFHRVLVDGSYYPIGSDSEVSIDVRFIATTNKDPQKEIELGRLKPDFLSRLNYFELRVPSLDQRPDDIPSLCVELLRLNLEELIGKGIRSNSPIAFDEDCWPAIQAREFNDNVRGLDKLIVRLIAHIGDRKLITPSDIEVVCPCPWNASTVPWFDQPTSLRKVRDLAERHYILEVCRHSGFNLRRSARILEISPKSLYAKLKQYGISRP